MAELKHTLSEIPLCVKKYWEHGFTTYKAVELIIDTVNQIVINTNAAIGAMEEGFNSVDSVVNQAVTKIEEMIKSADDVTANIDEVIAKIEESKTAALALVEAALKDYKQANVLDGAVTNQKLANLAVTNEKIADNTIASAKLADNGITAGTYGGAEEGTNTATIKLPVFGVNSKGLLIRVSETEIEVPSVASYAYLKNAIEASISVNNDYTQAAIKAAEEAKAAALNAAIDAEAAKNAVKLLEGLADPDSAYQAVADLVTQVQQNSGEISRLKEQLTTLDPEQYADRIFAIEERINRLEIFNQQIDAYIKESIKNATDDLYGDVNAALNMILFGTT